MAHGNVPAPLDLPAGESTDVGAPFRAPGPLGPWGPPPDVDALGEWRRYLLSARRHKWFVLGVTLAGTAAGVALASFLKPSYLARTTVWIEDRARDPGGPIWQGQLPISTGWIFLLQTNIVLEDVARAQRLYLAPSLPEDSDALATFRIKEHVLGGKYRLVVDSTGRNFTLLDERDHVQQRGVAGDAVGRALGFAWVPPVVSFQPGRTVEFAVTPPYEAAVQLGKTLKVTSDRDGNFLRLELGGPDPAQITAILNAVAERFVAAAADLKRENLTELSRILGAQLERTRVNLQSAETALKAFRVSAITEYAQGAMPVTRNMQYPADPLFAGLLDMKVNREQLHRDRAAIARILAHSPDAGLAVDALAMIGSVQKSTDLAQALRDLIAKQAELRALRVRYTDTNVAVRRAAAEVGALERQSIPALALALTREMALKERELGAQADSAAGNLERIPPLAVEETRLQREVTLAEQAVANVERRYEEARIAEASSTPDVRLLDPAVEPQAPARNWVPVLIALAFVGSLGAGVGGAVLRDRTDRHVQYPEHVTQSMGLTILGAVPHLERRRRGPSSEGVAQVVEAVRGIRLNVLHAHGAGPTIVTVTSPGRADGKSFIASNLALAFADVGHRTLLVDGDIRCGGLHRALEAARKPGLTDLLAGRATPEQVVQTTRYPRLWFIGSGTRTYAAPALVSSAAMPRAMAGLRPAYDAIIVDSPPLAAGVDAFALATVTGSLLLVLRTGVSDRELAQTKLAALTHLPIRVLGAVVNDVRPGGMYRYYSDYLEGYEVKDEPGGWQLLRVD